MAKTLDEKMERAESEDITEEELLELSEDPEYSVRSCVAWNDNATDTVFAALKDDECILRVIENKVNEGEMLSEPLVDKLICSCQPLIRRIAAKSPNCTKSHLESLACDESDHVRISVAENPNAPAEKLAILAHDKEDIVRRKVARNPSTSIETLVDMTNDGNYHIRKILAANKDLPEEYIRKMAEDEEGYVRFGIAANTSTPVDVLEKLASDKFYEVRINVILNPSTPDYILDTFDDDELSFVRERAVEQKNLRKMRFATDDSFTKDRGIREFMWEMEKLIRDPDIPSEKRIDAIDKLAEIDTPEARDFLYNIASDGYVPNKLAVEAKKRIEKLEGEQ